MAHVLVVGVPGVPGVFEPELSIPRCDTHASICMCVQAGTSVGEDPMTDANTNTSEGGEKD